MNRFIQIFVLIFISLFFISFSWALSIVNSKHDLSATGPGPVKAESETQICKFCHIPHAAAQSPLWNRTQPAGPWNMYNSAYLNAIAYAVSTAPSERSKLCLSCHDGTIAIGTLVNKGPVTMANIGGAAVTTMPTNRPGYLGTDLRNDHPVSIKYDLTIAGANLQDPGPGTFPTVKGLNIKLYLVASVKYVECTSCHEPHDNANTKFLVRSFTGGNVGAFCNTCHNPPNWTGSAHQASTVAVTNTASELYVYGGNVGAIACMNCHKPHSAPGSPYLRRFGAEEEATCYGGNLASNPCHGSLSAAGADKVGTQFGNTYRHPITASAGNHIHYSLEADLKVGGVVPRHVECVDCHNPHQVRPQSGHQMTGTDNSIYRTPRNVAMIPYRNALVGSWAVKPTDTDDDGGTTTGWPATANWIFNKTSPYAPLTTAGIASTGYTKFTYPLSPPTQGIKNDNVPTAAAYLCLKCHSQYAFGTNPPTLASPPSSPNASSVATLKATDVTANFNPKNYTYHPVFMKGQNRPTAVTDADFNLAFMNSRGIWSDSYITCYDCHASSAAADPRGPHGSANKWLLRSNETGTGTLPVFCLNCHNRASYGDSGVKVTAGKGRQATHPPDNRTDIVNTTNTWGIACMTCHGGGSYGGIHGSSFGPWAGTQNRSERMLDGANWKGVTKATTGAGVACWATNGTETGFDAGCTRGHAGTVGTVARYNYNWTQYTTD